MLTHGRWTAANVGKKRPKARADEALTPTEARRWHTRDGARVSSTPKLRHPDMTLHERDGPLQVVLLADYEVLAQQLARQGRSVRRKPITGSTKVIS